jgi:hypothetical protein
MGRSEALRGRRSVVQLAGRGDSEYGAPWSDLAAPPRRPKRRGKFRAAWEEGEDAALTAMNRQSPQPGQASGQGLYGPPIPAEDGLGQAAR